MTHAFLTFVKVNLLAENGTSNFMWQKCVHGNQTETHYPMSISHLQFIDLKYWYF